MMTPSPPCDKNNSTRWHVGKLIDKEKHENTLTHTLMKLEFLMEGVAVFLESVQACLQHSMGGGGA